MYSYCGTRYEHHHACFFGVGCSSSPDRHSNTMTRCFAAAGYPVGTWWQRRTTWRPPFELSAVFVCAIWQSSSDYTTKVTSERAWCGVCWTLQFCNQGRKLQPFRFCWRMLRWVGVLVGRGQGEGDAQAQERQRSIHDGIASWHYLYITNNLERCNSSTSSSRSIIVVLVVA